MSIPRSSIAWTTIGLILTEGIVPALSTLSPFWRKPRPSGYVPRSQHTQTVQDPWPTRDPSKNLRMSPPIKLRVRDVITTLELHSFQVRVEVLPVGLGRWIVNRKIDEPTGRRSGPCGRSLAWSRT